MPVVNRLYIPKDRSLVCLVFIAFMACGKNEIVVHAAAISPRIVKKFIEFLFTL